MIVSSASATSSAPRVNNGGEPPRRRLAVFEDALAVGAPRADGGDPDRRGGDPAGVPDRNSRIPDVGAAPRALDRFPRRRGRGPPGRAARPERGSEHGARGVETAAGVVFRRGGDGGFGGAGLRQRDPHPRRMAGRARAGARGPRLGRRRNHARRFPADRVAALPADPDPLGPPGGGPGPPPAAPPPRGAHGLRPQRERDRLAAPRADPGGRRRRRADLRSLGRRRRRPPLEHLEPGLGDSGGGVQHGQQTDAADHPALHARRLHPRRGRRPPAAGGPLPRPVRLDAGRG